RRVCVRRDVVAVHAGVVAGAEAGPGHAGPADGRTTAAVGERAATPSEPPPEDERTLFVVLLVAPQPDDRRCSFSESCADMVDRAGRPAEEAGKGDRRTERIDRVLALENPRRLVAEVPPHHSSGRRLVEGICAPIDQNLLYLRPENTRDKVDHARNILRERQ